MSWLKNLANKAADKAADALAGQQGRIEAEIDRDIATLNDQQRGQQGGAR